MGRYPRLFVQHIPVHITQRGHDRQPVFVRPDDYGYYLSNIAEVKGDLGIQLLGYCLMTNHVHLIVVPDGEASNVSKLMRVLAGRQTRRINRLENRTGTLWEGRFKASLIDTDRYLLTCYRYVDLNPVRAAVVASPQDYRWSSYRGHAGLNADTLLDTHDVYTALGDSAEQRAATYRSLVAAGVDDDELAMIRSALQRNQLTGKERFQSDIERHTGRWVPSRGRGRPGK